MFPVSVTFRNIFPFFLSNKIPRLGKIKHNDFPYLGTICFFLSTSQLFPISVWLYLSNKVPEISHVLGKDPIYFPKLGETWCCIHFPRISCFCNIFALKLSSNIPIISQNMGVQYSQFYPKTGKTVPILSQNGKFKNFPVDAETFHSQVIWKDPGKRSFVFKVSLSLSWEIMCEVLLNDRLIVILWRRFLS